MELTCAFAPDSPLERRGFEPLVLLVKRDGVFQDHPDRPPDPFSLGGGARSHDLLAIVAAKLVLLLRAVGQEAGSKQVGPLIWKGIR
jgi:hypothetical protein